MGCMKLFEVGKTYIETMTMADRKYPARVVKRTKCFVTFADHSKYKVRIQNGIETVYTAGSVISAGEIHV